MPGGQRLAATEATNGCDRENVDEQFAVLGESMNDSRKQAMAVNTRNTSEMAQGQAPWSQGQAFFKYTSMVLFVGLVAAFLLMPFNEDVREMFAAAKQADFHGSFPGNVVAAWDMKPIANRAIYYGLYRTASLFVPFNDKVLFEPASKTICVAIALAMLVIMQRFFWPGSKCRSATGLNALLLGGMSILSVSYYVILQSEWFASLFLLAAIGLSVSESRGAAVAAGLVAAVLFPLKGVTVLLVPIVPAAWVLMGLDLRRRSVPFMGGGALGIVLTIVFYLVYPQSWQDLVDSSAFQNSFGDFYPLRRLLRSIGVGFGGAMKHAPMLYVGLACTTLVARVGIARRSSADTLILLAAWGCAVAIVVIQGKWFHYHYGAAIVPALLSLGVWCSGRYADWREALTNAVRWQFVAQASLVNLVLSAITWRYAPEYREAMPSVLVVSTILTIALVHGDRLLWCRRSMPATAAVLSLFVWAVYAAPWTAPSRSAAAAGVEQSEVFAELDRQFHLTGEPSLLYLECAVASYYLGTKSALRWFYPNPIQRVHSNSSLATQDVHVRAVREALSYSGQFVILDATWMRYADQHVPALNEKLESEYECVWESDVLHDNGGENRYRLLNRRVIATTVPQGIP